MQQVLSQPNHGGEILNLLLVNNPEIISYVEVEDWPSFSDHRLIKAQTNYTFDKQEENKVEQYLTEIAKRYKAMNFKKAPWELVEEELAKVDWDAMEDVLASDALAVFHKKSS